MRRWDIHFIITKELVGIITLALTKKALREYTHSITWTLGLWATGSACELTFAWFFPEHPHTFWTKSLCVELIAQSTTNYLNFLLTDLINLRHELI